jgi:hypothetical protein
MKTHYCKCGCGQKPKGTKSKWCNGHHTRCISKKILRKRALYALQFVDYGNDSKETRKKRSKATAKLWKNKEYRDRQSKVHSISTAKMWEDPKYRVKMALRDARRNYKKGKFTLRNGTIVYYRSSWELAFIQILDTSSIVYNFICEPFGIKYRFKGKLHRYYPDYKVELTDGRILIVEIKGFEVKDWKYKKKAIKEFCSINGYEFIYIGEKPIESLSRYVN